MTVNRDAMREPLAVRPQLVTWLRIASALLALLVLIQAIFAGRGLYIKGQGFNIHGQIGNATFIVALVQLALVYFVGLRGPDRVPLLILNVVLVLLVVAQLGLGYGGRDSNTAASLHVPNGVLIFGLTMANLAWVLRLRR